MKTILFVFALLLIAPLGAVAQAAMGGVPLSDSTATVAEATREETTSLLGYVVMVLVVIGTLFSDKLRTNASKWSSTLLGILAALTLVVQEAMASGGLHLVQAHVLVSAVVMSALGILAPSLTANFPWLKDVVAKLFSKKV